MSTEYNAKFVNTDIAARTIRTGQGPGSTAGAIVMPIFTTSTFKQNGVLGLRGGHDYSRSTNPTRTDLDEQLAAVEDGKYALSFSSGLATIDVLLYPTIKPGDSILLGSDVYGSTYRLLSKVLTPWGASLDVVDITDLKAMETALAPKHYQRVWIEAPSNPLLNIADIAATAEVTYKCGTKVAVDNTFVSLILQRPSADSADVVVYFTTKYVGGHSDVVGSVVVVSDEETHEKVAFLQNTTGAVPSPFDSWLDIYGLKTLDLHAKRHSTSALKVAEWLESQSSDVIERVWYPGLESRPGYEIIVRQMCGGSGDIASVQSAADAEATRHLVGHTQISTLAKSLGGVESLIGVSAAMIRASVAGTILQVPTNLVYISVDIENVDDLIADLEQMLDHI